MSKSFILDLPDEEKCLNVYILKKAEKNVLQKFYHSIISQTFLLFVIDMASFPDWNGFCVFSRPRNSLALFRPFLLYEPIASHFSCHQPLHELKIY